MLSRSLSLALRLSPHRVATQIAVKNSTSTATDAVSERDPAPYFFNDEIHKLLQTVTRPDPEKVFKARMDGSKIEAPEYKFMTEEQLNKALLRSQETLNNLLQMPPVVKIRQEDTRIVSVDPALKGYTEAKYVFTDITFGVKNKDRLIVVREPNGVLRYANHIERDRLNQIYFPIPGREIRTPRMFEEQHLEEILNREDYQFILDRTCVQFDPDHPDYHRVTQITYDRIDTKMHHDRLRSTRHYGPFVFYLAWNKKINKLLLENITTERIEDAVLLIKLYYKLHPREEAIQETDSIKLIDRFIFIEVHNKRELTHALRSYLALQAEKEEIEKTVNAKDSNEEIDTK